MDYKIFFGITAITISIIGYIPYFKNTLTGKTKPHVFSWLIWGIITAMEFVGQIVGSAGAGAWVTGVTALVCFLIVFLSLRKGNLDITRLDWFSFIAAIIAILLWLITHEPLLSILLGILIDALGFVPTFRKSFVHPFQETLITWFLNGLKFFFALFALEKFTLLSSIYPIYLILGNWALVTMILVRRRQGWKVKVEGKGG